MANGAAGEKNVAARVGKPLAVAPQENLRPNRIEEVRGVTVPEDTIRPLNEHYRMLVRFIEGFLLFRELSHNVKQIRSAVESPTRWQDKWELLDDVRTSLETIEAKLPAPEAFESDLALKLADFGAALTEASDFLNAEDGPLAQPDPTRETTSARMRNPLTRMVKCAEIIEAQCRTNSTNELTELGRHVKNIFDQLQRRSTGGTSGSNDPAEFSQLPQEEAPNTAAELGRLSSEETNVAGRSLTREAPNGQ